MKEHHEFGYNNQTRRKRVTCNFCHQKKTERTERRREAEARLREPVTAHITESTEEPLPVLVPFPLSTDESEEPCANACGENSICVRVYARYTCQHTQCARTHEVLGRCIECGCSEALYAGEDLTMYNRGASSSGPVEPEHTFREEPDAEPEPENTPEPDPFAIFLRRQ
jgi:hypothetical protein